MATSEPASAGAAEWLARLPDKVFLGARELIREQARSRAQAAALEAVVESLRPRDERGESRQVLRALPSLMFAALTGDGERALPITIATVLLGRGVDVLDDLADGDRPDSWRDFSPAEMTLAATDLCCAFPPLALAKLDAPPSTILAMQRALARGFLRASAGQRRDLGATGRPRVSTTTTLKSAAGKGGAFLAILTTLPAILADSSPATVESCARFGRSLGTAISIREDWDDLFVADWSRDLEAGTRSYPIAFHLERQTGSSLSYFLDLLDRARGDREAQAEVRRHIQAAGVMWSTLYVIARYCERAQRALTRIQPREPAARLLEARINAVQLRGG